MSARVDPDPVPNAAPAVVAAALAVTPALPVALDPDIEIANNLPNDHPPWAKDALSLSQRARAILAHIKPIVIRVLTFWDHKGFYPNT
jgi:hypothetical protein